MAAIYYKKPLDPALGRPASRETLLVSSALCFLVIVAILYGFIWLAGLGDSPDNKPQQSLEYQLAADLDKTVADLQASGAIYSINIYEGYVRIDPMVWMLQTIEAKQETVTFFAKYCETKTGSPYVTILSSRNDNKLAAYEAFGVKIYE
jgi:hypothetical protein